MIRRRRTREDEQGPVELCLATHPTAARRIDRAKGWGGLAGLLLAGWLSLRAGAPGADVAARALAGGVVGYMAAWAAAVGLLRMVVEAELRAQREQREERLRRQEEEALAAFDRSKLSAA